MNKLLLFKVEFTLFDKKFLNRLLNVIKSKNVYEKYIWLYKLNDPSKYYKRKPKEDRYVKFWIKKTHQILFTLPSMKCSML